MKRSILVIGLIFLLIHPVYSITLSGHVSDKRTEDPITFAQIDFYDQDHIKLGSSATDQRGNWSYDFLPASVGSGNELARLLTLEQNYPNPFNPSTIIYFSVASAGQVRLIIQNILGQQVDSKTRYLLPGSYRIPYESRGSAGVYFYSVIADGRILTRKMIQSDNGQGCGLTEIEAVRRNSVLKDASQQLMLITSKFGYRSDTLRVQVYGGEYLLIRLETIHDHSLMIDLHNDVLYQIAEHGHQLGGTHDDHHTDIPRLRAGGVDIQVFVIWIDNAAYSLNPYQRACDYVEIMNAEFTANATDIQQAFDLSGAMAINAAGKIAGVMAVEGGHAIENSIENLITLYQAGMRYMTITWNNSTSWAVSAQDRRSRTVGLSAFGKRVISVMDSLGVIIDVSHTGIKTIQNILTITHNPIIASHSGVRALRNHYRNLYDDQIISIANTGGVVGVVFYPNFLSDADTTVTVETVIQHIDHIVRLVGIEHVAIGSDFDGIEETPVGLEDVSRFPELTLALLRRGYSREDVEKILGKNFARVFGQVCRQ